jgi:RNA-directed DNA polymerase
MFNPSDSCPQEPPAAMPTGTGAACGEAAAAKSVRASGRGGDSSANSRRSDGELKSPSVAGDGKIPAAQRGQADGGGSAAAAGPDTVVEGHVQKETTSCRNYGAAHRTGTQRTKGQQGQAPDGRDAVRSIGARPSVDSLDPDHHATSPARNEETPTGLSGRRCAATGAGDPPHGQPGVGSPTKPRPRRNRGDTPNPDISGREEAAQQPTNKPTKQDVHSAKWSAANWSEVHARVFRIQRAIHAAFKQGKHERGHRLQSRLLQSHLAKLWAVHLATEISNGAATPGVDGLASLSDAQKWRLAITIRFDMKPEPVRRAFMPKGKNDHRPLGIPTIRDRAIQHLIKLALEPAAETILAPEQFGFRPGRGCWDAIQHIRLRLRKPSYVLDADIRKFFDRIDHDAILRVIPGSPVLIRAIRRLLKAGIMDGVVLTEPEAGTPQGGPVSPLLANLVLADLAASIRRELPVGRAIHGEKIAKVPYVPSYADDFLVTHGSPVILTAVREHVEQWLALRGLELHPDKTAIRHTATMADGYRGIRFLGLAIRHHRVGRHQAKGREWFLWSGPSQESLNRVYEKAVAIIDGSQRSRKRNGAIRDLAREGKATPEEVMVIRLNRLIRGWCGYHCPFYAKETFSKLDHLLFIKLWKWAIRKHPKRKRAWIVRRYFNNAKPWCFTVTTSRTGKPLRLVSAAATPIVRHYPVKAEKSWFDGDWAYWAKRAGRYPMLTARAGWALKRQAGKCPACKRVLTSDAGVVLATFLTGRGQRTSVTHRHCAVALRSVTTESVFVGSAADRSPVLGNWHAGFEEPAVSRGTVGSTHTADAHDCASAPLLTGIDPSAPGGNLST